MQVSNKIDQLIASLKNLKPLLTEDKNANSVKFSNLLRQSLENSSVNDDDSAELVALHTQQKNSTVPSWVDPDYGYDPKNPRKPNMRELMEAMSGKNVEDLYSEPNENLQNISRSASEMLYGVIGSNLDTRDWQKIMIAPNVLAAAQSETGKMYEAKVDIESQFNDQQEFVKQVAILKDSNQNTIRTIPDDIELAKETLQNFGLTKDSIPNNLEDKIIDGKFDPNLLNFLKNYENDHEKLEKVAFHSAIEIISKNLLQEIPLSEYNKL